MTAMIFGLSVYVVAPVTEVAWILLVMWLVLVVLLMVLATYDARWLILPDKVMVPLVVVAVVYALSEAVLRGSAQIALSSAEAAVLGGGFFYALAFFSKGRAMGGGDIKLVFVMGLILGVQGLAVALLVAFNSAAAVGLVSIARKKLGRKDHIPFGPYLVGATFLAYLYGRAIVDWYLHVNGLA
jgi:leader peptidase (prepilin peptidase)/N-methyltransferase